jgi:hypothetical protein
LEVLPKGLFEESSLGHKNAVRMIAFFYYQLAGDLDFSPCEGGRGVTPYESREVFSQRDSLKEFFEPSEESTPGTKKTQSE